MSGRLDYLGYADLVMEPRQHHAVIAHAESNNSRADPIVRTAASRRLPATAREAIGTGELRLRIYARHRKGGKVCWCGREETPFGFLIV